MVYKALTQTVRKYYKTTTTTQSWSQQSMSSNMTLGGDSFAVTASYNTATAYNALNSTGWDGGQSTGVTFTLYNPNPFCITKLVLEGFSLSGFPPVQIYIKSFTLSGSNDNSTWTEIQTFSGGSVSATTYNVTNSVFYKYYKLTITEFNQKAGIRNMAITATEQVTVYTESTSSDYDFYEDVNTYRAIKETSGNTNIYKVLRE